MMGVKTYQVSQTIQLLPHRTTRLPTPRHLPIQRIKEKPQRDKRQRRQDIPRISRVSGRVTHGCEHGHDAAEAVELGDQVREVHRFDEGEVAGFGGGLGEDGSL